ncbi:MAG: hypothetical protein U0414_08235 [Polyangiaceae bacterium]
MSDRPAVKKSSPSPIARSLEAGVEPRPVSPIKRLAIPLGVAAALALAGGAGITYAVAGSSEGKHATRDGDGERRHRDDDSDRKPSSPATGNTTLVEDVFQKVGDFLNPDTKVEPAQPKPTPTVPPTTYIPPTSDPVPLGGAVAIPNTATPVTPPPPATVKAPIVPPSNPPAMPGGLRPPAPASPPRVF